MGRIAIFVAGVLFGLAFAFFLDLTTGSAPATEQAVPSSRSTPVEVVAAPEVVEERNAGQPAADEPPELRNLQESPTGDSTMTEPPTPEPLLPEPIPSTQEIPGEEPPSPATPVPPSGLLIPVQGIKAGQLADTFTDSRGSGRAHDAIDIMAARGTPVVAVDDGRVVKLFNSVPGGLTVYQFDPTEKLAYYYAHLDRYASGVVEGRMLIRGDVVGYVGSTGNASSTAPHLHFAIFVLGPEKRWWEGTAINPYPLLSDTVPPVGSPDLDSDFKRSLQ